MLGFSSSRSRSIVHSLVSSRTDDASLGTLFDSRLLSSKRGLLLHVQNIACQQREVLFYLFISHVERYYDHLFQLPSIQRFVAAFLRAWNVGGTFRTSKKLICITHQKRSSTLNVKRSFHFRLRSFRTSFVIITKHLTRSFVLGCHHVGHIFKHS